MMDISAFFLGIHPAINILLIGAIISITMSLVNRKVLSSEKALTVKKKMQEERSKMLEAQKCGDTKKMNECLTNLMRINSQYMGFMMKPMIISFVIFLVVAPMLRGAYTGVVVATVPQSLPFVGGFQLSWFWWYAICTFVISMIAKKLLEI